ncbi:MAG: hypothetical protein FD180_4915 [Planctomycetota bacterium]|nr:MAG: hypothetical protein FD180_4915 [Planctomycetota bacterium]
MRLNRWLAVRRFEVWTFGIVCGSLGALTGLWIAGLGALETRRAWERENWPVAEGAVLQVEERTDRVANGRAADSLVASYAFLLDGRRVTAEQAIAIPTMGFTFALRENTLRSLRRGPCRVHYNPANPAESFIVADPPLWEAILLGLSFTFMGVIIAAGAWWKRRQVEQLIGDQRGLDSLPKEPPGVKRWEVGVMGLA